jgi:PhnB protein
MPKITPVLAFKGNANQAIELYQKALGARIITRLNYSDADPKDFQFDDKSKKDCVYYAEMVIGSQLISFGDDPDGASDEKVNDKALPISLLIEFDSVDGLRAAYELMSEGATILTPMGATTYCTGYVSLVDRFGIQWDLMSGYVG